MNLVRFNSFAPTKSIIDDMFDEFFNAEMAVPSKRMARFTQPLVNVIEEKESFKIEMAIPGVSKEDVQINLEQDQLIIKSAKEQTETEENDQYTRKEFYYGSFVKSFHLPDTINRDTVEAKFRDGILHIELKKKEEAIEKGPKQIEIK
jgi:HSP20 family protein